MVSAQSLPTDVQGKLKRFAKENPEIYAAYCNPIGVDRDPVVHFVTSKNNPDLDVRIITLNSELTSRDDGLYLTILQISMPQEELFKSNLGRRFYSRN